MTFEEINVYRGLVRFLIKELERDLEPTGNKPICMGLVSALEGLTRALHKDPVEAGSPELVGDIILGMRRAGTLP